MDLPQNTKNNNFTSRAKMVLLLYVFTVCYGDSLKSTATDVVTKCRCRRAKLSIATVPVKCNDKYFRKIQNIPTQSLGVIIC